MVEFDQALAAALVAQGKRLDETPASDILDLLARHVGRGELKDASIAFTRFCDAFPLAKYHLLARLPSKLARHYFDEHLALPYGALERWISGNPSWQTTIDTAIEDPECFEKVVKQAGLDVRTMSEATISSHA